MLRSLPPVHRAWFLLCAAFTVVLMAARDLHYLLLDPPLPIARALDHLMHLTMHLVIILGETGKAQVAIGAVMILLFLARRRWLIRRDGTRRETQPWVHSVVWTLLALNNFLLDVSPWVLHACLASTALIPICRHRRGVVVAIAFAAFAVGATLASPTRVDAIAAVAWSALLALLLGPGSRLVSARDRLWLGVVLATAAQVFTGAWPIRAPAHGGRYVADGMAYAFCENTARGRIYAVVPGDENRWFRDGFIEEIAAADLSPIRRIVPFPPGTRGRLIVPVCLPDRLLVGMGETRVGPRLQKENVLELSLDDPPVIRPNLFDLYGAQSAFHDQERHAVYWASEWSDRILRLDLRTGAVDRDVGAGFLPRNHDHWRYFGDRFSGSFVAGSDPHPGRGTFFVAEWLTGSTTYEIDARTLTLRSRLEPHDGGVANIGVDDRYDRLFLSSMWGLDVMDLATGRPVRRLRTGFGCRTAVIDRVNDLVYVPATIEGRIRVLDRATLDVVGTILIGRGTRNALFTSGPPRLLAGSQRAYYYWDAATLGALFR